MRYEIIGGNLPAAICKMRAGETIICEKGAMSWMTGGIKMQTKGGGLGKMIGRNFSGEAMFRNYYTAQKDGEIAFASSFPGQIVAVDLDGSNEVIAQKRAFLACDPSVEMSVFFQKKIGAGFFGGEGFIMQRFRGRGTVLLEIDGATKGYSLAPGERLVVDTGYLALMDGTCSLSIEGVGGVKNALLGGEGFFNTVVTGPGNVVLQTMPIMKTAMAISAYIPSN